MPPDFQVSYSDYAARFNGIIAEAGIAAIKSTSKEVAELTDQLYYDFFGELYRLVGEGTKQMPSRFMGHMGDSGAWKPLSEAWSDRKLATTGREDFYAGLTQHLNAARRKASKNRRKSGKKGPKPRNKMSFQKFLAAMSGNSRSRVEKLFGKIGIDYYISATGRKTPIKIEQKQNIINEIARITSHDARGKIISNYNNVSLRADINMFPALKAAKEFSEYYVVDVLAQRAGTNSHQWMKINSRFGHNGSQRAIRPIITPLISWYATTGLQQIIKKFYR